MLEYIIIALILLFIYIKNEYFKNYVKLPWVHYSQNLNQTIRGPINHISYNFTNPGRLRIWGYRGSGNPESDNIYFVDPYFESTFWVLLLDVNCGKKKVYLPDYPAYHFIFEV